MDVLHEMRRLVRPGGGPKLHHHFRAAGFAEPILHVEQSVLVRGDEKRFWECTLIDEAPALVSAAAATAACATVR